MIKQSLTCVILLMLIGHHDVRTASLNMESSVGVLGNYPHYVKCSFIPASGETLLTLDMYQIVSGGQTILASLYNNADPIWDVNAPSDIKRRSLLMKLDPTSLQLFYNDTVCSDEKSYTCNVSFRDANGNRGTQSSSNKVTIEASPGAPTMTAVPGYNITESTTVTFTCTGNVGKPPGQFEWYMYRGSIRENKTDKAAPQSNTLATPSCTYIGKSSINITMTRMEQNVVMRCRVYHPTQGSNTNIEDCTNPDASFCRNGERMSILCHHNVRTASLNMESSVGVLGNYPHYVKCSFIPASGELLYKLDMYQIVSGGQTSLGTLYMNGDVAWVAPSDIKRRSLLMKPDPTSLQLFYNDTVCSDEKNYTCIFEFRTADGNREIQSRSNKVTIEASPGAPTMTAVPGYNITENTTVTFTCTGNVGKPPGQFEWYMYRGNIWENKTDKAAPQSNTLATPSCTYTGRSSINITMTRMEQNVVMRCRVYHPTQGSNTNIEDCTNPDASFCRNGERMVVFYPVSISISAQSPSITVDQGSDYILTCNAEGFPSPVLRWFKKSDPSYTLEKSSTLKLQNLSLSDSDVYVCIGLNNVNGAELNDSKQVQITVVPITRPPLTTTSIMSNGHHNVRTASLNMESSVGVLGNYPHYVKCSFIPASGETLLTLDMYQIVSGGQTILASLYNNADPIWDVNAPSDIKRRSLLMKLDPTSLLLLYNDTVCSDEKSYTCNVSFRDANGNRGTQSSSNKVTIEGCSPVQHLGDS